MAQALDGVRVIDCSTGLAGPMAGMMLADFGADVVKVEGPGGDPGRENPGFVVWNRGKRSIVLDRDDPAGRQRLEGLLAGADLVVVSDPREALAGGPLDPEVVLAANPHLVYLHIGPYTDTAPWAGAGESAELVAAETGVADRQFSFEDRPVDSVYPQIGYCQAIWGAACGVAALVEREKSGFGQRVLVGGLHAVLETSSGGFVFDPRVPRVHRPGGHAGPSAFYRPYECGDGEWLFLAGLTEQFRMNAAIALDVVDVFADERIAGEAANLLLPENHQWVTDRIGAAFKSRTRDEWLQVMEESDCPAGPVLERDDWLDHEQIIAIGMRVEVDDPERGQVVMPGQAMVLTGTPADPARPAPTLGQHDGDAGWEPRPAPSPAHTPHRHPGPLTGVRVLDLGTIIAGTFAASLLGELGAEVTKVESLTGDTFRFALGFAGYNMAKDGLAIDLRRPEGKQVFLQMVRRADIVIDNYRPGVLERLGIHYDDLVAVKPDIITLSNTGFGEGGPLSYRPGFDPVFQSMSGIMKAQGGDSDPGFFALPVNDVTTAASAAFGSVAALFHRERTGQGQRTWTSLAGNSCMAQSGELVRYEGRPPALLGGRDFPGPGPFDRYYQNADGWIRVQAKGPDAAERLRAAGFLPDDAPADDAGLVDVLTAAFLEVPRDEAWRRLTEAGIPAGRNRDLHELIEDHAFMAEKVVARGHQASVAYLTPGRFARFSRTERDDVTTAPGLGADSTAVLVREGFDPSFVADLIEEGVVFQGEPLQLDRFFP